MISPQNHIFDFSPDLLLAQQDYNVDSFGGLISPNFVGTTQKILMHDCEDTQSSNQNRKNGGRNNKRPFMTLQGK
jgi:hypothetical protein